MPMLQRILVLGAETPAVQRVVPLLRRAEFQVVHLERAAEALELARRQPFDVLLVRFPLAGMTLPAFVGAVRAADSACLNAGLVILAEEGNAREVGAFLARGVSKVVTLHASSDRLLQVMSELLDVAPRRSARVPVSLELVMATEARNVQTVTENVSTSGMLVRGGHEFAAGSRLTFALLLPGEAEAVAGEAAVVRHTDPSREPILGAALRILTFAGDGLSRLQRFVEQDTAATTAS